MIVIYQMSDRAWYEPIICKTVQFQEDHRKRTWNVNRCSVEQYVESQSSEVTH